MSKTVRVTDKTYNQLDDLKASGYESLTNALSVAVDRLYRAERPKEKAMTRDEIMEQLNADNWSWIVGAFDEMNANEIEAELDTMFPREDNADLAWDIEAALKDTRRCILATEDNGTYEIHPNAEPEAWVDIVNNREVSEAVPVEQLTGWGRWSWVYRVQYRSDTLYYFADTTPDALVG